MHREMYEDHEGDHVIEEVDDDDSNLSGSIPVPRSGHRIVVDEANLYSLGGFNPNYWDVANTEDTNYPIFVEIWKYNFATRKWSKLEILGKMPSTLASHSVLKMGNCLFTYGGSGVPFGDSNGDELTMCRLDSLTWYKCNCSGDAPSGKYGHTMLRKDDFIYIIGGTSGLLYNMDVHKFNLDTHEWTKIRVEDEPAGRYRHETVSDGKCFYNFGGGTAQLCHGFEKIDVFRLDEGDWKEIKTVPDDVNGYPCSRRCHSCVLHKNYVFMCGGYNGQEIYGDLWQFNLFNYSWTKLPENLPEPCYFHSADITADGCMYIFGGVTGLGVEDRRTNSLYKIYLDVPSLQELCWERFTSQCTDLNAHNKTDLLLMGIPKLFVDRIT